MKDLMLLNAAIESAKTEENKEELGELTEKLLAISSDIHKEKTAIATRPIENWWEVLKIDEEDYPNLVLTPEEKVRVTHSST